jgi:hypothetical protein
VTAVDPLFAQWLQAEADYVTRTDAVQAGRWGATALTTEGITGIATRDAAEAQADRELAFWARGPFAEEVHQLVGLDWPAERGRVVTLIVDQLGYDDGLDVFVLGAEADRATGLSSVTVLRPMGNAS